LFLTSSATPRTPHSFPHDALPISTIKGNDASKSAELAKALSGAKKIVVCTIQTFPFALEAVRKLAATQGKRFAVIADEAHSSQTDRKSTRLNSSHVEISYAVFCLK